MSTFLVAVFSFVAFIVAYHTYGRWLARKIFRLDPNAEVPSCQINDGVDYVPSPKTVVFGHHFTSIAGTGPIVGPAIAVFWGWLPALLWVVFGSIFIGAVHDFGALVVSLRNRGQTVGEIAGRLISPRTRFLFLLILFFSLTIVLAIFGLVIAAIFKLYPETVLPVWISLPIAIVIGIMVRRGSRQLLPMSIAALVIVYAAVYVGAYYLPIELALPLEPGTRAAQVFNPTVVWTIILLAYCAVASVLPVWLLLQPRDYVNSLQLLVALALLVVGLFLAGLSGTADLTTSAPALVAADQLPLGTPPIWPFLFITIACGAISGFHCLVSSGTSSKQLRKETDAQFVGYGSMLLEGALAVIVILACCAGTGMGKVAKLPATEATMAQYTWATHEDGSPISGRESWATYYTAQHWSDFTLGRKVGAFIEGGANFLTTIGLPLKLGISVIAVLVACFAATTLDTATRLQRYVIQELGGSLRIKPLTNMYVATGVAVVLGGAIAMMPGQFTPDGQPIYGSGGLILWPLFGATNQLLAGLAFMVTAFYLWRRNKPVWFVIGPMIIMIILPAWALVWQLFSLEPSGMNDVPVGWFWGFVRSGDNAVLTLVALATLGLQLWMVFEALTMWPRVKGVLEEALPPLPAKSKKFETAGGRSC